METKGFWKKIFPLILIIALILLGGCAGFGNWISKKIYPSLVVPLDLEPPVTIAPILLSTQLTALIGGQGGGINCSIPALVKPLFFNRIGNSADVNLKFRQACATHDLCYRHGNATYSYTQADCDFSLQENAFRICTMVYAEDSKKKDIQTDVSAQDLCRDQARQVLLGVRIGGGGSFKVGEASTYFEYDPVPHKANDYSIVRWLETSDQSDTPLSGSFWRFHTKNGRFAVASWPSSGAATYSLPMDYTPTAPVLVEDPEGKSTLVSLARKNLTSTNYVAHRIDMPSGSKNEITRTFIGFVDRDSTVTWFSPNTSPLRVTSWRKSKSSIETCELRKKYDGKCAEQHLQTTQAGEHDTYRTIQSTPLRGRFLGNGCSYYAILRRGTKLEQLNKHDDGKGYESTSGILLASDPDQTMSAPCLTSAIKMAPIPETNEPLGVIEGNDSDYLLGISAQDSDKSNSPVSGRLYSLALGTATTLTAVDPISGEVLDANWVRRPVAVLEKSLLSDRLPHLVFTRVRSIDPAMPRQLGVDVLDFPVHSDKCAGQDCLLRSVSGASCQLQLEKLEDDTRVRWAQGPSVAGRFSKPLAMEYSAWQGPQVAFFKRHKAGYAQEQRAESSIYGASCTT